MCNMKSIRRQRVGSRLLSDAPRQRWRRMTLAPDRRLAGDIPKCLYWEILLNYKNYIDTGYHSPGDKLGQRRITSAILDSKKTGSFSCYPDLQKTPEDHIKTFSSHQYSALNLS